MSVSQNDNTLLQLLNDIQESAVESQREYKIYNLNLTKVMMSLSNLRLTQK